MEYSIGPSTITRSELPQVYEDLKGDKGLESPTITWNDGGDEVVIVAVNNDWSMSTMMTANGTSYYLVVSDDNEEVPVQMDGHDFEMPRKTLAPRELGLKVLLQADIDFPSLLTDYTWEEQ